MKRKRQSWDSRSDMIISMACVSINMVNLLNFPYECIENGGITFLITYFVVIFLLVRPLFFLEVSMGTFAGCCNIMMFEKMGRLWKGIGVTQCVVFFIGNSAEAYIMSVCLFYFFQSFSKIFPWDLCVKAMGPKCFPTGNTSTYDNFENQKFASAYLYLNNIAMRNTEADNPYTFEMCIAMFLTWTIIAAIIWKNIKSFVRMAYFIAIFPSLIMFILFLRSILRQGSYNGAKYFFTPNWSKIRQIESWIAAINHSIFSFSLGVGSLSLYGSYSSNVHTDIRKISMMIMLANFLSNVLCCVSVFCSIGTVSFKLGIDLEKMHFTSGLQLALVIYPTAISLFDEPPYLYAAIFFIMLFMLGVGSNCAGCHVIISSLHEYFPRTFSYHNLGVVVCVVGFVLNILYSSYYGKFLMEIVVFYVFTMGVLIIIIAECCCFIFSYGLRNACFDIEFITTSSVSFYWRYCWTFLSPMVVLLYAVEIWSATSHAPTHSLKITGHILIALNCFPIVYYLTSEIIKFIRSTGDYKLMPRTNWQPRLEADRIHYQRFIQLKNRNYPPGNYFGNLWEALTRKCY